MAWCEGTCSNPSTEEIKTVGPHIQPISELQVQWDPVLKNKVDPVIKVHAFILIMWEGEAGWSLSSRPAWYRGFQASQASLGWNLGIWGREKRRMGRKAIEESILHIYVHTCAHQTIHMNLNTIMQTTLAIPSILGPLVSITFLFPCSAPCLPSPLGHFFFWDRVSLWLWSLAWH